MHDIYNITTIFHCSGIIFNTRELAEDTIISQYYLFHSLGIIFNTREKGGEHYHHPSDPFHSPGIIFNTRAGGDVGAFIHRYSQPLPGYYF